MDRIDGPTTIDIGGGRRGFRGKDTMAGVAGTEVRAKWLNGVQEEIVSVIEKSGLVADSADLLQLLKAIRSQRLNYVVAGGTANALTVTLDPAPAATASGQPLRVLISATNTGAATLNDGLGHVAIVRNDDTPLLYGDLRAGSVVEFVRKGAVWQVVGLLNSTKKFFQGVASAGGILTVDQIGSVVQFGVGAGSYTVALPVSSACPNGGRLGFFHNGNYPVSLVRQGVIDQIAFADGTVTSSITLRTGDTLELLCLGESTTWLVIGGTIANRAASDFKQVLGTNDYKLLPGGMIEQWGNGTGSASGGVNVTLPTTFPNQARSLVISAQGAAAAPVSANYSALTASGFTAVTTFNGSFAALPFSYRVIGN